MKLITTSSLQWQALACSADGTTILGAAFFGYIYVSTDSGATFTPRLNDTTRAWATASCSSDCSTMLVAGGWSSTRFIYKSVDYGNTWTEITNAGISASSSSWMSSAISANASVMVVGPQSGRPFVSRNSGGTWTEQTSLSTLSYSAASMSADGMRIVLARRVSTLLASFDFGSTWVTQPGAGTGDWTGLAVAGDGSRAAACANSGYIYTASL